MHAQSSIPYGRPQPKLSKLVAEHSQTNATSPSTFVFWDLQNTPLPTELCALPNAVLEALLKEFAAARLTIVTEVPASTLPGTELLKALNSVKGLEVLTFLRAPGQSSLGTAADYQLKRALQRFLPNAPSSSILLLVSSDVNLLSDIYQAKDNGLNVHLLCNEAECGSSLLEAVDVHQDWRTFLQSLFGDFSGVPFVQTGLANGARANSPAPQGPASPAENLNKRTIGIFYYPDGSDLLEVGRHAEAFARPFGKVMQAQGKKNMKGQGRIYAVINFETVGSVQAALGHGSPLNFRGTPLDVRPWGFPSKAPSPGPGKLSFMQAGSAIGQSAGAGPSTRLVSRPSPQKLMQTGSAIGQTAGAGPNAQLVSRPLPQNHPVKKAPPFLPTAPVPAHVPAHVRQGVTAVRFTYPEGIWPDHAKVHAAACASSCGEITRVWTSQSGRSNSTCVGVEFSSPAGVAEVQRRPMPPVRGGKPSVIPWQGKTIPALPGQGPRPQLVYASFAGLKLATLAEHQAEMLQNNKSFNFAVAALNCQETLPRAILCISLSASAPVVESTFRNLQPAVTEWAKTSPVAMSEMLGIRPDAWDSDPRIPGVPHPITSATTPLPVHGQQEQSTPASADPNPGPSSTLQNGVEDNQTGIPVLAAVTATGSRNMFLGVPGIRNIASGMTKTGQKMSYTVFESQAKLETARDPIKARLAEMKDPASQLLEGPAVATAINDTERSANLTVANGLFDFLYHKRDRRDLPEDVTDAVCCMVVIQGQCWQIGSPEKHLRETHCKGETIEQSWVAWSPSQLQVPAPVGSLQSQGQLLSFLSSLVNDFQHKLAVFNCNVEVTLLMIMVTAGDKHGLAMGKNSMKVMSRGLKYSLEPYTQDNPLQALTSAQKAIRQLPNSTKVFATGWSGGILFCATSAAALAAGIQAYKAAA